MFVADTAKTGATLSFRDVSCWRRSSSSAVSNGVGLHIELSILYLYYDIDVIKRYVYRFYWMHKEKIIMEIQACRRTQSSRAQDYAEGRRAFAVQLGLVLQQVDPRLYVRMLTEAMNQNQALAVTQRAYEAEKAEET